MLLTLNPVGCHINLRFSHSFPICLCAKWKLQFHYIHMHAQCTLLPWSSRWLFIVALWTWFSRTEHGPLVCSSCIVYVVEGVKNMAWSGVATILKQAVAICIGVTERNASSLVIHNLLSMQNSLTLPVYNCSNFCDTFSTYPCSTCTQLGCMCPQRIHGPWPSAHVLQLSTGTNSTSASVATFELQ